MATCDMIIKPYPFLQILAREIVRSNQAVKRLYNSKAHLLDVQTGLQEQLAYVKVLYRTKIFCYTTYFIWSREK